MKKLLIAIALTTGCTEIETEYLLKIGNRYNICSPWDNNPFEKQREANVIITDMKQGYVQYCWADEYNNPTKVLFSRSEKEFVDLINFCNR